MSSHIALVLASTCAACTLSFDLPPDGATRDAAASDGAIVGCIDDLGTMHVGDSPAACGSGGRPCAACATDQRCDGTACVPLHSFDTLASGASATCGLAGDALWCWGTNRNGQLGRGTTSLGGVPPEVVAGQWTVVASGRAHVCAIRADGEPACWGNDGNGALGNGPALTGDVLSPMPIDAPAGAWTVLASAENFSCGAVASGDLYCWGRNHHGQLGVGVGPDEPSPRVVGDLDGWTGLSLGRSHSCGLRGAGELYCWGSDLNGKVGGRSGGPGGDVGEPFPVGTGWEAVSAGDEHTCGIRDGGLYCWGSDAADQLGLPDDSGAIIVPTQVGPTGWTAVTAGGVHTCGLRDGSLLCWGGNERGQVGIGSMELTVEEPTVVDAAGVTGWRSVSAYGDVTCALDEAGVAWCWGGNTSDRLAVGSRDDPIRAPARVVFP